MAKRPSDITYWVKDIPPPSAIALLSLQHLAVLSIYLVVAVALAREGGLDAADGSRLITLTMLAAGAGSILQSLGRGGIGSGYLLPTSTTAILLPPGFLAMHQGGPGLLCGMTLFAAVVMLGLARILPRLRVLFPPETAGFVVFMVGVSIMVSGVHRLMGFDLAATTHHEWTHHLVVALPTLALIVGLSVWGTRGLRLYAALIGIAWGYVVSIPIGLFSPTQVAEVAAAPMLAVPAIGAFGLQFDARLALPYLVAAVAMALNSTGAITAAQRSNDTEWERPDMANIGRGITANALTNILAALVGGCGQSSSPGSVGLAVASSASSRIIGFGIGALWLALAFSPKVGTALLIMPPAVIGPALIFSGCLLVVNGAQAMTSRMLDARKSFAVGIALAFGLARVSDAHYFKRLPEALQPWVSSPLALAVTVVVLLNALFRIGIHQRGKFMIDAATLDFGKLGDFMSEQGRLWGAKPAVVYRATYVTNEIVEALAQNGMLTLDSAGHSPIEISTRFDEFTLVVSVFYKGDRLEPRNTQPTPDEIMESEDANRLLAAYLIGQVADKARSTEKNGGHEISVTFNA